MSGLKGLALSRNKSPAFQFYPTDFLADENVAVMGLEARGAYITLMCHCWLEGTIPREPQRLAKLCGVTPRKMAALWPELDSCFRSSGPKRLHHPRLRREKRKQDAYHAKKKAAGRKGGKAKAAKNLASTARVLPLAKRSSSSATPSATPSAKNKQKRESYPKDFEQWWAIYPRKDAKKEALEKWNTMNGKRPPTQILLEITRAHAHAWAMNQTEKRYIPQARRWLHRERWLDELTWQRPAIDYTYSQEGSPLLDERGQVVMQTVTWGPDELLAAALPDRPTTEER